MVTGRVSLADVGICDRISFVCEIWHAVYEKQESTGFEIFHDDLQLWIDTLVILHCL